MVSFIRTQDGERLFALSHVTKIAIEPKIRTERGMSHLGRYEVVFYSTEPHHDARHIMFEGTKEEVQVFHGALIDQVSAGRAVIDPAVVRAAAFKAA